MIGRLSYCSKLRKSQHDNSNHMSHGISRYLLTGLRIGCWNFILFVSLELAFVQSIWHLLDGVQSALTDNLLKIDFTQTTTLYCLNWFDMDKQLANWNCLKALEINYKWHAFILCGEKDTLCSFSSLWSIVNLYAKHFIIFSIASS